MDETPNEAQLLNRVPLYLSGRAPGRAVVIDPLGLWARRWKDRQDVEVLDDPSMGSALTKVRSLVAVMRSRQQALAEAETAAERSGRRRRFEPIVLVLPEYAALVETVPAVEQHLMVLAAEGGAVGMRLIIVAQAMSVRRALRDALDVRVVTGPVPAAELMLMLPHLSSETAQEWSKMPRGARWGIIARAASGKIVHDTATWESLTVPMDALDNWVPRTASDAAARRAEDVATTSALSFAPLPF